MKTHFLDLTGEVCPINFVRTKIKLEELESGEVLEVVLDDGSPIKNVPRSLKAEGHEILEVRPRGKDSFSLFVRKA